MTSRRWRLPVAVLACTLLAATVSLHHMEYLPALVIIAPGYLVQAWLFVRHHALGGLGYQLTMIGVSSVFWTLVVLLLVRAGSWALRRRSGRRAA